MNIKAPNRVMSNVVPNNTLKKVQQETLRKMKDAILPSAGPFGSTTQIIKADPANPRSQMVTEYTKDGHTILKNLKFDRAIEDSLQREFTDVTRYIVKEVGDGTSSTVILSSIIFDNMMDNLSAQYPPYFIIQSLQKVISEIQDIIKSNARELQLEDVYDIAMICTNGNKDVASTLSDIYKEHGKDVFIDVGISGSTDAYVKTYDGLTIEVGYSDPVYVNTPSKNKELPGSCILRNPRIYAFTDPIDTIEMHNMFNMIIFKNIMEPYNEYMKTQNAAALKELVPTVILAPKISVDMNSSFDSLVKFLYGFNQNLDQKPPIVIISNISEANYEAYSDIWNLCGCKPIKKYIDPKIQEKDIELGKAPTLDTIVDFYGKADEVKVDSSKTVFINPVDMFAKYEEDDENNHKAGEFILDEDGYRVYSEAYNTQVAFLEQQLQLAINEGQDYDVTGSLRRRIHTLKANMVDYLVGGVTPTDRDATRALVEDAVKNIRSAARDGLGFGTNFEGLRASAEYEKRAKENSLDAIISKIICNAYWDIARTLYATVYYENLSDDDELIDHIDKLINKSLTENCPMNFRTMKFDGSVLCSIKQDVVILEIISKIISIIYTTNQSLTQTVQHNMYMEPEEF